MIIAHIYAHDKSITVIRDETSLKPSRSVNQYDNVYADILGKWIAFSEIELRTMKI